MDRPDDQSNPSREPPSKVSAEASADKSLMRNLGECVGHVIRGIRTDPGTSTRVVRHDVEEQQEGDMIMRRTTIEEIEFKNAPRTTTPGEDASS